ncbi:MAG: ABC transporter substrate-binding protein [Geminicoccaceae bacterium]
MLLLSVSSAAADEWEDVLSVARGQTVYWNAWGGDERTNAFISWVGEEVSRRFGVTVRHVKLADTAEAIVRVLAEQTAGRGQGGSVDLIWINGTNLLTMRERGQLFGPFVEFLPNYQYVDTTSKLSNLVDFTIPVDGMAAPWRLAQLILAYDSARISAVPRSAVEILDWALLHPGRFTHPHPRDFLGVTFLKQALYELAPDSSVLLQPANAEIFAAATAPLWDWYDRLLPMLWHDGRQFPDNGPAARRLLDDLEIDLTVSFDPAEPAGWIRAGLAPPTVRAAGFTNGSIGNTSFVAIPFNASSPEGAMVVANFLLDPLAQARAQDVRVLGSYSVLDLSRLGPEQLRAFEELGADAGVPGAAELGPVLLEPHPSWSAMLVEEWTRRYGR